MERTVKIKVNLETKWIDVDPDGQECYGCGDSIYLFTAKSLRVGILTGGSRSDLKINVTICQSCFDVARF